ncbi:hypothetical protein GCM10015535_48100 [Streptomyces gelaticus]|uniref:Uncharacterized protein n=1 Tax=Streptomyces gelaticus TaxID=285446 RepID=A0ABQ2W448_9ACTN|nr:hypothetical protein GCM10015535_48100 [Streptomyces gelaticus]
MGATVSVCLTARLSPWDTHCLPAGSPAAPGPTLIVMGLAPAGRTAPQELSRASRVAPKSAEYGTA